MKSPFKIESLKKKIEEDSVKSVMAIYDIPNIKNNLNKLPNLNKIMSLSPEEIFLGACNDKRFNLSQNKPFNYSPFSILTHDYSTIVKSASYVLTLERLLGKVLKSTKIKRSNLKEMFLNNFADFGLFLSFVDYCIDRRVKNLELNPVISNNKKLDLKITVEQNEIFLELFSPIEATLRGNKFEVVVEREIKKHKLQSFDKPLIFLINTTDYRWARNGLNRGRITDEMFFPIKKVVTFEKEYRSFPQVSAFLIKHGHQLNFVINKVAKNKLSEKELKVLVRMSLSQKIKSWILRFY